MALGIQSQFRSHVYDCLKRAEQLYDVDFGRVTITFDITNTHAGVAYSSPHPFKGRVYGLKFNKRAILRNWDDMVYSTIPHEVAHLVAFARPDLKINDHDYKWRSVAINLGDIHRGAITHSIDVSPLPIL